jgi:uncharacterized protein YecE (DUF72 family)
VTGGNEQKENKKKQQKRKKEVNYSYKYSIEDLKRLNDKIKALSKFNVNEVYVLFNNLSMNKDAENFMKIAFEN